MEKIKKEERPMLAVARLITALGEQAITLFQQKKMRDFDANTGGAACQLQAIALYNLLHSASLEEEASILLDTLLKLKKTIQTRGPNQKSCASLSTNTFVSTELKLEVSEEMLYLMRARLLTVTKILSHTEENGIVVTKTDPNQLSKLSNRLLEIFKGASLLTFVAHNAEQLCRQSIEKIQIIAAGLKTADPITVEMLSERHILSYAPVTAVNLAKPFSCLLFQMRALLQHLKEQNIPTVIKTVEKNGAKPKYLSIRQNGPYHAETPLIVIEGVAPDLGKVQALIEKIGFEKMIFICAAQDPQYHPRSTLEDVKDEVARNMIVELQAEAEISGLHKEKQPTLLIDHVFCTVVKHENIGSTL